MPVMVGDHEQCDSPDQSCQGSKAKVCRMMILLASAFGPGALARIAHASILGVADCPHCALQKCAPRLHLVVTSTYHGHFHHRQEPVFLPQPHYAARGTAKAAIYNFHQRTSTNQRQSAGMLLHLTHVGPVESPAVLDYFLSATETHRYLQAAPCGPGARGVCLDCFEFPHCHCL